MGSEQEGSPNTAFLPVPPPSWLPQDFHVTSKCTGQFLPADGSRIICGYPHWDPQPYAAPPSHGKANSQGERPPKEQHPGGPQPSLGTQAMDSMCLTKDSSFLQGIHIQNGWRLCLAMAMASGCVGQNGSCGTSQDGSHSNKQTGSQGASQTGHHGAWQELMYSPA